MLSTHCILYFMLLIPSSECTFLDKANIHANLSSSKRIMENTNDHNNISFGNQSRMYTSTQMDEQMFSTVDYETDTETHEKSNFTISVDWGQTNLSSMW